MAYIKVAMSLRPAFEEKLVRIFGKERVKVAPVKSVTRCIAKAKEYQSPAEICDYLRATILSDTIGGTVDMLARLTENFKVVVVKDCMLKDAAGNKAFLLKLVFGDPLVQPTECRCFGVEEQWWPKGKLVQMVCEVQITLEKLYYANKQSHLAYHPVFSGWFVGYFF